MRLTDVVSLEECLVSNSVKKIRILILDWEEAAGVVHDGEVGVELAGCETHQPPWVVGCHIETESCWDIAFDSSMESYQRFVQAAGVRVGETFTPELDSALEPDLVLNGPSSS